MKELIHITPNQIGHTTTSTCSARELHRVLGVGRDFTNWIKGRIEKYGYQQGKDFEIMEFLSSPDLASSKARPQTAHEYILTTEMGKELAMVEENATGRLVRRYFIYHTSRSEELVPLMAAEILRKNPLWQSIKKYRTLGLSLADIARLVQRAVRTVRHHVRRMEALGLIAPPANLANLRKSSNLAKMQAAAGQLRLPGMEVAA